MEPERELGRINGLGVGRILGFTLIVTDQRILGLDTRSFSKRMWLYMLLGLTLGLVLTFSIVYVIFSTGLERALSRTSPVLDFLSILIMVFTLPIGMVYLVPRFLCQRPSRTGYHMIRASRKDIIRIEARRPSKVTQKGFFTVSLMNGDSFTFWTVRQEMFDYVNTLLAKFAPGQIGAPTGDFTDLHKPRNQLIPFIFILAIILIVLSAADLSGTISSADLEQLVIATLLLHLFGWLGYLGLRRLRRRLRRR